MFALVSTPLLPRDARAFDFGDTLTFGELRERGQPAKLYNSESLTTTLELSEALSWNLDAGATHYLANATSSAFSLWRLGAGMSWDVDDHLSIDLDETWSPRTGYSFDDGEGSQSYRVTSLGLSLDATYDLDPHNEILDHELLLSLSTTRYVSTESELTAGVVQAHVSAGAALTVLENTRFELEASYYVYANGARSGPDALGLHAGASVPIEPLRFALRADLTEKLGKLRLAAYVQGGSYASAGGEGLLAGARFTWVVSDSTRLTLAVSYQRMQYAAANPLSIPSLSAGLRISL